MLLLHSFWFKSLLLAVMAGLALTRYLLRLNKQRRVRLGLDITAGVVALVALVAFFGRGAPFERLFLNKHDLYHYWFGAKYADELGHDRLYHCTLLALDEIDPARHANVRTLRSLVHYQHVRKDWYLKRPHLCRRRFSDERWTTFKADLVGFQKGRRFAWKDLLSDKGYHPTPVWTVVGRFCAHLIPPQPTWALHFAGILDLALLAVAMAYAGVAFGLWGTALAIIYMGACYALTRTHVRGSLLRLDWLACLLGAVAALQARRRRLAGALMAYAAAVRIFPVLFLFGPAVGALRGLYTERRLLPRYRQLFGAFLVGVLALGTVSVVADAGLTRWSGFVSKMRLHVPDIATTRLGLEYVLGYRGEQSWDDVRDEQGRRGFRKHYVSYRQRLHRRMAPLRLLLAALVLAALAWGLKGRDDVEALALSFPAIWVLLNPTFYYYCLLLPPLLVFASRPKRGWAVALVVAFAAVDILFHVLWRVADFDLFQYFLYSALLGGLTVTCLVALAIARRREEGASTGPPAADPQPSQPSPPTLGEPAPPEPAPADPSPGERPCGEPDKAKAPPPAQPQAAGS